MGLSAPASGVAANYVRVVNEVPYGTPAGTITLNTWTQRNLTAITDDDQNLASLAANVLTLAPGSYRFQCIVPLGDVSYHQARLHDTTNSIIYLGTCVSSDQSSTEASIINGYFTLATSANFIIESHSWQTGPRQVTFIVAPFPELWIACEFFEVQA